MFKYGWKDDMEKQIGGGIYSNLKNRLIVMLDEELSFDDVNRYLLVREKMEKMDKKGSFEESLGVLYEICDILCSGRLVRLHSDINAYFGRRIVETKGGNVEKYRLVEKVSNMYEDCMNNFKGWFEKKDSRCYYWMFKLYEMGDGGEKKYKRREYVYGLWEYLESLIGGNEKMRRLFQYRLESFYEKNKKERRMFMIGIVKVFMYMGDIDWEEDVEWKVSGVLKNKKLVIDGYCIDMHCKEGRYMGKSKVDFVKEGSFIVDEYVKYKVLKWREYYIEEGNKIGGVVKGKKVVVDKKVVDEKKVVVEEKKKRRMYKGMKLILKDNKLIVKRGVKEVSEGKKEMEFISMDSMEFVRLCSNSVCGGKVMCFVVKYNNRMYVMKEGRKSMKYNKDYEMVDSCKEIFGLKKIGMRRILSDVIIEKVDKEKKEWENNWRFVKKENVVYCMMEVIEGKKLIDVLKKNRVMEENVLREFMKIGLWRGIFGVSDFSSVNVMKSDGGDLISIDEHDLLGSRKKMLGDRHLKMYRENKELVEDIFEDLYRNKEEKIEWIRLKMLEFGFENEIEDVLKNYMSLREKFNNECY